MLVIKSLEDLKQYLETRKAFADRQANSGNNVIEACGRSLAYTYAIQAVDALVTYEESNSTPLAVEKSHGTA